MRDATSVSSYDSLKDFAVCTSKLSGEWKQLDSEGVYNYFYAIGESYWECVKHAWSWPILRYTFPEENSFQVEVKTQTGWWLYPGNCFVQIYELNEENQLESNCGATIISVTTMKSDKITSITNGRRCGTIVTERKLASDNENIMLWSAEIVESGIKCQRRFKRVYSIASPHHF